MARQVSLDRIAEDTGIPEERLTEAATGENPLTYEDKAAMQRAGYDESFLEAEVTVSYEQPRAAERAARIIEDSTRLDASPSDMRSDKGQYVDITVYEQDNLSRHDVARLANQGIYMSGFLFLGVNESGGYTLRVWFNDIDLLRNP